MVNFNINEQFIIDQQGNKIAVVIDIETYQKILDDLDEFYCERAYEKAVAETNQEINQGEYLSLEEYMSQRNTQK